MAFIKKLTKLQDKFKKMASSKIRQAKQTSIDWLKSTVAKKLGFGTKAKIDADGNNWVLKKLGKVDAEFEAAVSQSRAPLIGHMYFYIYDPKWKKQLPYYDTFPLVIPIGYWNKGLLGLNFHYLPPLVRAVLLDSLLSIKAHTIYNGRPADYMKISYELLKGMSKTPWRPTIKKYIWSHVKSNFAHIHSDEWENAVFLPVEQFKKANKRTVWKDSREMIA
jgi:hypothetical protein